MLRPRALEALRLADPTAKVEAARALQADAAAGRALPDPPSRLVALAQVPRRSPFTPAGRAALLHAVAHIDFNAIKKVFLVDIPYRET